MEHSFYSRATGKLRASTESSYIDIKQSMRDSSTIYSIGEDEEDSSQYPLGELSETQLKYIRMFVLSITSTSQCEIDSFVRAIHWVGGWSSPKDSTTIMCCTTQPIITNAVIHLSAVPYHVATRHSQDHFINQDKGSPTIMRTGTTCQIMGKYAIPFVDSLIAHQIVSPFRVRWSNIVVGQTQPIFIIVRDQGVYECTMTYNSALIMLDSCPTTVRISHPVTGTLKFSFRSARLTNGNGSGPHVTLHGSGIIQYQGNPIYMHEVVGCFKECIVACMRQEYASQFIKSLNVIRKM